MGRFSWALQDPARNHPLVCYGTTWDSRRAYLSFSTFVGTGLSWLYFVCSWTMEAIGRRWSLLGWI